MAEVHPYLSDPVASFNLPIGSKTAINDAFLKASKAGIRGCVKEAHEHLEAAGNDAKALPGYFALLAEIEARQGAFTGDAMRQALERLPPNTSQSPFEDYCELIYQLGLLARNRENHAIDLARGIFNTWLSGRKPQDYDHITVSQPLITVGPADSRRSGCFMLLSKPPMRRLNEMKCNRQSILPWLSVSVS